MQIANRLSGGVRASFRALNRAVSANGHIMGTLEAQRQLVQRYHDAGVEAPDLTAFEFRVFSQNGEDGVIAELLSRCGEPARFFVEFGVGNGAECNTAFLAHTMGFSGLYLEPDPAAYRALEARYSGNPNVRTLQEPVSAENINDLFRRADVPEDFDVLSIDIDGNDYYVWQALETFRPRIVVIEYNGSIELSRNRVQPYDPQKAWDHSSDYGASLAALEELATGKGYRFAHSESIGVNAFFVRDDLAAAVPNWTPRRAANFAFSGSSWHPDPRNPPSWQQV